MSYTVRSATADDLDEIYSVWLEGVHTSLGAKPQGDVDYRGYFKRRLEAQDDVFRYFVVENERGRVVSWQSLSPFRSNPAVAGVMAELSAYTSRAEVPGWPTLLGLEETFRFADNSPLHYVVAFVAMNNTRALRLATRLGMTHVGTLPHAPQAPQRPQLAYLVYPCKASPAWPVSDP